MGVQPTVFSLGNSESPRKKLPPPSDLHSRRKQVHGLLLLAQATLSCQGEASKAGKVGRGGVVHKERDGVPGGAPPYHVPRGYGPILNKQKNFVMC